MRSLFIDTATSYVTISIIKDNNILYKFQEFIKDDMSSKILPIIETGFNNVDFNLKELDRIFVVNGPGSFTGVRIGVVIAKTISWGFNIPVIAISSLELMASTPTDKKYIIPMIDARRGNVFGAIYDNNLNIVKEEQLISKSELLLNIDENYLLLSYDIEDTIFPDFDLIKIINKHLDDGFINPHSLNPRYLKLTEAEEKFSENK